MSSYLTAQTALPPRTEFVAKEAGDLARLRIFGASQLRDSAGFSPDFANLLGIRALARTSASIRLRRLENR